MKNSKLLRGLAPIAACALLLPTAVGAQTTSVTATGWVNGLLTSGLIGTNAGGQVLLRGIVHTWGVLGSDARLTGQVLNIGQGAYNADGTANVQGPAYLQVGTWDPARTNFTPTAGMWEMAWRGVLQTNNSFLATFTGYGSGGTIDGLRMEGTLTRGAGAPFDPAIPYLGTARIEPVEARVMIDNFDDNKLTRWNPMSSGQVQLAETNRQLTVRGYWPGVHSTSLYDSFAKGWISTNWTIADGQTLEWRVDLVGMNENTSIVDPGAGSWSKTQAYVIGIGRGFVALGKLASGPAVFSCDRIAIKQTNVVLSLALTRVQTSLVITGRVLDKDNHDAVLFMRSVVDTPEVEPTLTTAQFEALTGMHLQWGTDLKGPPLFSGDAFNLEMFQYNDGTKPAAEAVFDNLELRTSKLPPVSIQQAVQLAWPSPTGVNYSVEGAPTVNGPWLPVQDLDLPGIQKQTVLVSGPAQFFRLIQTP